MTPRGNPAGRQRGAALLMAMLIVTLVATFASLAAWQQWRASEVEGAERARAQAGWVLVGALDWSRLILAEDARAGGADYLAEPWAVPLEEARLSTFLAAGQNDSGAADIDNAANDVFLSGRIVDLQSRLNVRNLVDGNQISQPALAAFGRLFALLGLPTAELNLLASNLQLALATSNPAAPALAAAGAAAGRAVMSAAALSTTSANPAAPLLPQRVGQLVWLGLSPATVAALRPYVTLLPMPTPVNLNTASAAVLYACIPGIALSDAQRLVSQRTQAHFATLADASAAIGRASVVLSPALYGVASSFFEVRGRLRIDQTVVQERSVVQRQGINVRVLWRERGVPAGESAEPPPDES